MEWTRVRTHGTYPGYRYELVNGDFSATVTGRSYGMPVEVEILRNGVVIFSSADESSTVSAKRLVERKLIGLSGKALIELPVLIPLPCALVA